MSGVRGLSVALKFMTRLPAPSLPPEEAGDIAAAAPWLPAVGAIVGVLVALAVALGAGASPWVGALIGVLAWTLVTGGLHLEALGDAADGLAAAHGRPERFLEVARDPHTGAFGVMAIALQVATKLVFLATMAAAADADVASLAVALALVAAWARWGALVIGSAVPPLSEGLAARLAAGLVPRNTAVQGIGLAIVTLIFAPILLAAVPLAFALSIYWRLRIGGVNGDALGASIEVTEAALLLLLIVA